MAIKSFKEIIENKGYRISAQDREIFEQGNLQSFFGLGEQDAIEFVVYDINDNQLPQTNGELIRYVPLTTQNIKDYILLPEGTIFQKYKFPKEYFIDAERLLREAGYNNGVFKTQITLINKRVGSDKKFDKLYINQISPTRTEIRLLPLKKGIDTNPELLERFNLIVRDGNFRDDTIYFVFQFIERVNPQRVSSFIRQKYSDKFLNRLKTEFKIQDFEVFCTQIYEKFVESCAYEFTNRVSTIGDVNYGKIKKTKIPIELTVSQINEQCKRIFIQTLNYYLLRPNVNTKTTFDDGFDISYDEVGKVLQRLSSDTKVDTSSPVVNLVRRNTLQNTNKDIAVNQEKKAAPTAPVTTDDDTEDLLPAAPAVEKQVILRNYMVQNFSDRADVVVRFENEFGDGKQIKLQATDAIDICAVKDSVNIVETDVKVRIKDAGPCDKVGTKQGEKPIIGDSGGGGGGSLASPGNQYDGSGGNGTNTGGGRNNRYENGDTRLITDPSVENTT